METQIYLLQSKKHNKVDRLLLDISKELPKKEYQMDDLFLENFKNLRLPKVERQNLSFEARKRVKSFLDLDINWLEEMAAQLVAKVNKLRRKVVHIKADNIGSFICLYALKYFKLEEGKELVLHLLDCPVRLFERYIARLTDSLSQKIHCQIEKSSWLYPYETLYQTKKLPFLKAA